MVWASYFFVLFKMEFELKGSEIDVSGGNGFNCLMMGPSDIYLFIVWIGSVSCVLMFNVGPYLGQVELN